MAESTGCNGRVAALTRADRSRPAAGGAERPATAPCSLVVLDGRARATGTGLGASPLQDGRHAGGAARRPEAVCDRPEAGRGRGRRAAVAGARRRPRCRNKALERDLRRAAGTGALTLHYQPKFALPGHRLVGAEALLRWAHPERGPVSPADFVPIAEASGLIVPIGAWALRTACDQIRAWRAGGLPRLRVAVNLSARQVARPNLVAAVAAALEDSGLEADALELEITESAALDDSRGARATLAGLRALGVRIALDDFGTGHAALSYLRCFTFDALKIDRGFVAALGDGARGGKIVRSVIDLAHGLNMTVTAEGVETAAQLGQLEAMACDEVQGFLLAPPEPAAAFEARLRALAA